MKRVLTMTLNPCVDRTIYLPRLKKGGTNYVDKVMEEAAGKGINVAVALSHIGVPVKAIGFSYKEDKEFLYTKLEAEQVAYEFVDLPGRMRVNQKLFDMSEKQMTECNERGQKVSASDVERIIALLEKELEEAAVLVLSGSVPPGVDANIYGRMICKAKERNVLTVLDASGNLLAEGCKEKPYLIKPNQDEFKGVFMPDAEEKQFDFEMEKQASMLVESGIGYVCISLGEDGMMLADHSGVRKYAAMPAEIMSLQGAGDAMVAGICKAIYEKEETKMAEYALKMAHSTISLPGSLMGTLE